MACGLFVLTLWTGKISPSDKVLDLNSNEIQAYTSNSEFRAPAGVSEERSLNAASVTSDGTIILPVNDLEKALIFYEEILGFTQIQSSDTGYFLELDGFRILLDQDALDREALIMRLIVDDLANVRERLSNAGVSINIDGYSTSDPDGNRIEFIERP